MSFARKFLGRPEALEKEYSFYKVFLAKCCNAFDLHNQKWLYHSLFWYKMQSCFGLKWPALKLGLHNDLWLGLLPRRARTIWAQSGKSLMKAREAFAKARHQLELALTSFLHGLAKAWAQSKGSKPPKNEGSFQLNWMRRKINWNYNCSNVFCTPCRLIECLMG